MNMDITEKCDYCKAGKGQVCEDDCELNRGLLKINPEERLPRKLIHDSRFDEPVKVEPGGIGDRSHSPIGEVGHNFGSGFDTALTALRRGRRM